MTEEITQEKVGVKELSEEISRFLNEGIGSDISFVSSAGELFTYDTIVSAVVFDRVQLNNLLNLFISKRFPGYICVCDCDESHETFDQGDLKIVHESGFSDKGMDYLKMGGFFVVSFANAYLITLHSLPTSKIIED